MLFCVGASWCSFVTCCWLLLSFVAAVAVDIAAADDDFDCAATVVLDLFFSISACVINASGWRIQAWRGYRLHKTTNRMLAGYTFLVG